jgi:hypothetical protein
VSRKALTCAALTALSLAASGCGVVQQGRAPAVVRIEQLSASAGAATPGPFVGYLHSDVITNITRNAVVIPTRFNDSGSVTLSMVLRDPGIPGQGVTPTELNTITVTHYRVVYRRTDGRNVQGVDVPFAFDSGMTMSIPASGSIQQTFDIVRVSAKLEAPLMALAVNGQTLDVIADVTFYGKDQYNNDVAATGSIGITFANFGDAA